VSPQILNFSSNLHLVVTQEDCIGFIRPHKLDSLFSVSTFSIFHAGSQSLFIIHYSISSNMHATPLIKGVWPDDHWVMLRLKVTRAGFHVGLLVEMSDSHSRFSTVLACHWRRNERFDSPMSIVRTFCVMITMNNENFAGFSKWHAGGDA
jgi:hypothetical protein